jgi:flavodoxin
MNTLVVYDSVHGNTEKIARVIGGAISGEVQVLHAKQADASGLAAFDLVILGAPTHGGRPSPAMQEFLGKVPASAWQGKKVASFDTRVPAWWVKIFGFAAPRMARKLSKLGATLAAPAEGFFVKGTEGPLTEGEEERAAAWAKEVAAN